MQRPPWERRGLKLPQERKKRRHLLKAKMQRKKGKNKFAYHVFITTESRVCELPSVNCPLINKYIKLKAAMFLLRVLLLGLSVFEDAADICNQ